LVRIASYGPQIDQSHGENRLSHIIKPIIKCVSIAKKQHVTIVKNMLCLELLDGLFFCDECLGQIVCIEHIANIKHTSSLSNKSLYEHC